jgi:hypothetical protein
MVGAELLEGWRALSTSCFSKEKDSDPDENFGLIGDGLVA